MTLLVIGLILFLGIHSLSIVNDPLRNRLAGAMGEWPFKAAYGLIALVGLVLIIQGYAAARLDPTLVYTPSGFLRHPAMLLLVAIFPLLLAAYLPGRISRTLKHPMLVAVKLWALAHLLTNGMLHDVVLFGSFLAWAVADRISLKRRTPRKVPSLPANGINDAIAVIAGLALYGVTVMWAHQQLIGVTPV